MGYAIRVAPIFPAFDQTFQPSKENNEGQAALKEIVSLMEEPGKDLKVWEHVMKSIRDPGWNSPRNGAFPGLQHVRQEHGFPAKRMCFTWGVHAVPGPVPSLSKRTSEGTSLSVSIIYLQVTFMVLPNEEERRLVESDIFSTNDALFIDCANQHVAKASKDPEWNPIRLSAACIFPTHQNLRMKTLCWRSPVLLFSWSEDAEFEGKEETGKDGKITCSIKK